MKVFGLPAEVEFGDTDYRNYDTDREIARENEHKLTVKAWLIANGYTGKNTGRVLSISHADGYAHYMLAEGKTSCLIHLPYGDGWNSPLASGLTKKAVLEHIARRERMDAFFADRRVADIKSGKITEGPKLLSDMFNVRK